MVTWLVFALPKPNGVIVGSDQKKHDKEFTCDAEKWRLAMNVVAT
jgi:hypothetical protein